MNDSSNPTLGAQGATLFYFADITGAVTGDPLTVTSTKWLGGAIVENGTTTTPEPGTYSLMALGLAVLVLAVRNRKSLRD